MWTPGLCDWGVLMWVCAIVWAHVVLCRFGALFMKACMACVVLCVTALYSIIYILPQFRFHQLIYRRSGDRKWTSWELCPKSPYIYRRSDGRKWTSWCPESPYLYIEEVVTENGHHGVQNPHTYI